LGQKTEGQNAQLSRMRHLYSWLFNEIFLQNAG
jgi:hypothetical protein